MTGKRKCWKVYCCFHIKNQRLWNELECQLAALKRLGLITVVCDQDISPGHDQQQITDEFVSTADIILLLISSYFIESDHHWEIALRAIERHKEGKAQAIYVSLSPILHDEALPIEILPRLPKGRPVTRWPDLQEALVDVVKGIRDIIAEGE